MSKLINISELSKKLRIIHPKDNKPMNYILRYWEKEFKQIKPKIINNRRYYSENQVEIIKLIKYLLKDKGMTIKGAKIVLNSKINKLDEHNYDSLKANFYKFNIKEKSNKLLTRIKNLKSNYLLCGGSFFSIKNSCFLVLGLYFLSFNLSLAFSPFVGFFA